MGRTLAKLRWPKSIHSQIESIFSAIKAIGVSKAQCPAGHIRSIGTMNAYLREAHSFAKFIKSNGVHNLRDTANVQKAAGQYLAWRLEAARAFSQSLQTQETRSAALSGLERAFNAFFAQRGLSERLNLAVERREYLALSRAYLGRGREYEAGTRAYSAPERLVAAIDNETYRLQASLQYQGGLRAEGVGAPSGKLGNPLTWDNMKGLTNDPVTGMRVGHIEVREKGGKWTSHYIPRETYASLVHYLEKYGSLQSRYNEYRNSVATAAKLSGQYAPGRGTHGLKTVFAQQRYMECVQHGFSHERAMQQVALELAHNRADVTLIYTKG
jgi:hypothetical protein